MSRLAHFLCNIRMNLLLTTSVSGVDDCLIWPIERGWLVTKGLAVADGIFTRL